ncbi:molybdopterin converting factor subunit 1 [uncultured Thiocystis sp.]|jgi:molybdopterin synthase sulfur carrier subunit|uniref:molybdopterin converting factor subunit 1 n=1 Tax=uncultured Thiocystis sp. TaxID=1202134 RepID=UPI0025D3E793|nr:molybdopterin converting factor subunit 1 [uncultured Thiocystis sp.]
MIKILYFARLRERLGCQEERLDLPAGVGTIADLLAHLRARGGLWAEALGEGERFMSAVNQEIVQPGTSIRDGDEVAFFPPVTGG